MNETLITVKHHQNDACNKVSRTKKLITRGVESSCIYIIQVERVNVAKTSFNSNPFFCEHTRN